MTPIEQTEPGTISPGDHKQRGIDRAADQIYDVSVAAHKASLAIQSGDYPQALALAKDAERGAGQAMNTLTAREVGAKNPLFARRQPVSGKKTDPFDLSALATLDTPDARELLALLEQAQAVAERVDRSRGKALAVGTPLLPGESLGTDLAESLSTLALRVRIEVNGSRGKGQE